MENVLEAAYKITLSGEWQGTRIGVIGKQIIEAKSGHTLEDYSVQAGAAGLGKSAKTYFALDVYDDEEQKRKKIELTMFGEEEREILIGLLKAAVAIMEGNEFEFIATPKSEV